MITLKYAKETSKAAQQQQQELEQNWIHTSYIQNTDNQAQIKRQHLYCKNKENLLAFELSDADYLNKLLGIQNVNMSQNEAKIDE